MSELKELLLQYQMSLEKQVKPTFPINEFCFGKQLSFINDPHPFVTAVCSVRAGKTVACAADLITTSLARANIVCLYITLSRNNAKKIIWPELVRINRDFSLGGKVNETELSIKFPNESIIYCSGAKDKTEIEKFRGLALALCYIDECQAFRSYIQELVDEVIAKRLFDYAGRLRLIGTPGPVAAGYFYDCSRSPEWSHNYWTMFDNPWLPRKSGLTHEQILERELKRKGVTKEDPAIQRECFGRWTNDPNSLVFRYDKIRNDYISIPASNVPWQYVLGVDIGFHDADAIAVIGWNDKLQEAYLVEELITHKQGITELASQLGAFITKYNPSKIVMDTGGLGKKIAEEIRIRFAIPVAAAEKTRKFEYIEILNDALRTRKLFAKSSSRFAEDSRLVEWDRDNLTPDGKLKIRDTYHSDICDAVLYGFREALHWLYEEPPTKPKQYSEAWFKKEEEEMYNQDFERLREIEENEENYYENS